MVFLADNCDIVMNNVLKNCEKMSKKKWYK